MAAVCIESLLEDWSGLANCIGSCKATCCCVVVSLLDRYEFGKVTADGRRDVMASGRAPTATLTGLALSTAGVYVCAVDSDGAKVSCARTNRPWG